MSRARKISSDLRHVATLAGTTAAVVEGAAIAAERARSVAEHITPERDVDSAPAADVADAVAAKGRGGRKLLVLLLLAVLAAVGIAIWRKRQAASDEEDVADLRDEARFAGSMP